MERLPCQFASVDVEDVMGTSVTNVTKEILKFKVAPDSGHRQEFYPEQPRDIEHEVLTPEEEQFHMEMPDELPQLGDKDFEHFVKTSDLVLVAFGAPWCPWSQRLEPVWAKTHEELKKQPYAGQVRMGRVDCTAADAQQLCQRQHIHAFPTIRVFRHKVRELHVSPCISMYLHVSPCISMYLTPSPRSASSATSCCTRTRTTSATATRRCDLQTTY